MNEGINVMFFDNWAWLIAIGIGLVLIILELLLGIDTGFDMVFIGSAFAIGGLITLPFDSWIWTALAGGVICILYVVLGRRYVHRRTAVDLTKTNIDTIIGKTGVVLQDITLERDGLVKVGHEEWRARAEAPVKAGEVITVTGVSGVTLDVKRTEGGLE